MGEFTGIRWTDHTFNGWWGCVRKSEACRFCYAENLSRRFGFDVWGAGTDRREFGDAHWNEPLLWNRKAAAAGKPELVFTASMADVFEDHPQLPPLRERLWALIEATPWLTWQLLTKRPENILTMVPARWLRAWPPNCWAGTTVENQRRADERMPYLVKVPAPVLFVSGEPLLGAVDLSPWMRREGAAGLCYDIDGGWWHAPGSCPHCRSALGWVIAGGESGTRARVSHPDWFRSLRDQCQAAGVPFLFKQWGEWTPAVGPHYVSLRRETVKSGLQSGAGSLQMDRLGKKAAGWILDGRTWDEIPRQPIPAAA